MAQDKPAADSTTEETLSTAPSKTEEIDPIQVLQKVSSLLQDAVSLFEPRLTTRALRMLPLLRKKLESKTLHAILNAVYPNNSSQKLLLSSCLPDSSEDMQIDAPTASTGKSTLITPGHLLPELDFYVTLLVVTYLLDNQNVEQGLALTDYTVQRLQSLNRRTLDQIQARIYFYYARFHELTSKPSFLSIRPTLLVAQQTASLRHDSESLATLLNLILRNYYAENAFEQADKFIARVKFPQGVQGSGSGPSGNNQLARWMYYVARLRAIQLRYSEAHTLIQQAIRRAPAATHAPGFYQTIHKLSIVVELLMGDIPERSLFREPVLSKTLSPYLHIVQAVRIGDLQSFTSKLNAASAQFKKDETFTLIARLRHNVIKTALRTISLAYSRIPLRLICTRLGLDSEEEAEYIVAKAIRDGVVEANLDHEKGYMMSNQVKDVYSTAEPMRAFDERIKFCLNLRNESVKAMRFPLSAHKKELENVDEAREREKEMAQEILDGKLDDDEP